MTKIQQNKKILNIEELEERRRIRLCRHEGEFIIKHGKLICAECGDKMKDMGKFFKFTR